MLSSIDDPNSRLERSVSSSAWVSEAVICALCTVFFAIQIWALAFEPSLKRAAVALLFGTLGATFGYRAKRLKPLRTTSERWALYRDRPMVIVHLVALAVVIATIAVFALSRT